MLLVHCKALACVRGVSTSALILTVPRMASYISLRTVVICVTVSRANEWARRGAALAKKIMSERVIYPRAKGAGFCFVEGHAVFANQPFR